MSEPDEAPTLRMSRADLIESCVVTKPCSVSLEREEPFTICVRLVAQLDASGRGSVSFPIDRSGPMRIGASAFWVDATGRECCIVTGPQFASLEGAEYGLMWRLEDALNARGGR